MSPRGGHFGYVALYSFSPWSRSSGYHHLWELDQAMVCPSAEPSVGTDVTGCPKTRRVEGNAEGHGV